MKRELFYPLILLCSFTLFLNTTAGQAGSKPVVTVDTVAIGRVFYQQEVELGEEAAKNGLSVLLFNPGYSLYFNLDAPSESKTLMDDNMVPHTVAGDKYGFPYYKMHRERKIIYRARCLETKGKYLVEDTLGSINWTLQPEHKRFGKCDGRRACFGAGPMKYGIPWKSLFPADLSNWAGCRV